MGSILAKTVDVVDSLTDLSDYGDDDSRGNRCFQ